MSGHQVRRSDRDRPAMVPARPGDQTDAGTHDWEMPTMAAPNTPAKKPAPTTPSKPAQQPANKPGQTPPKGK